MANIQRKYFYAGTTTTALQRVVGAAGAVLAATPVNLTLQVDSNEQDSLDDYMASIGWMPGGPTVQSFQYVATGLEGAAFTVNLPVPQPNTNYQAIVTGNGLTNLLLFDAPASAYTLNSIQVKTSAPLTLGDTIGIVILVLT